MDDWFVFCTVGQTRTGAMVACARTNCRGGGVRRRVSVSMSMDVSVSVEFW